MPDGQIDPARLAGEDLRRWFQRTPDEIERERQAAYEARRREFYDVKAPARPQKGIRSAAAPQQIAPVPSRGVRYGELGAPPSSDLAELRRQQAEFAEVRRGIAKENSWMAGVALAPAAAVVGLEAGAALAARLAPQVIARGPLVLSEQMPYLRVGHNWATRAGQRADKFYKAMAEAKEGWKAEPRIVGPRGKTLKPDIGTPARTGAAGRNYIEVKPNTPSGRAAAARQTAKYREATGRKVRTLFYDPKKFM